MKKWHINTVLLAFALVVVSLVSCRKNRGNDGFSKTAMLTNYSDNYIIPAHTDLLLKISDMQTRINEFATKTDTAHLMALRQSWKEAYIVWQSAELVAFGPGEAQRLRQFMNSFPAAITKIENNITTNTYELETEESKDAQGFPALDYLLNGIAPHDTSIVTLYTTDGLAANRIQCLKAVTQKMVIRLTTAIDAWNIYRTTFIESTSSDTGGSISILVNGFIKYYENHLCLAKVGKPAGVTTNVVTPQAAEAYYFPTLTNELARTSLVNANMFFEGFGYGSTTGSDNSLRGYLISTGRTNAQGQSIAYTIGTDFVYADSALGRIPGPIQQAVVADRPSVLGAYQTMTRMLPTLKVDMAAAFGVTVK